MALDATLTLILETITLTVSIPLVIKFAPRIKKAFAKAQAQQGDASTNQTGSIAGEKPAVVLNTGHGNTILNNSGTIVNAPRPTGKTQRLKAQRSIQVAFKKFFFLFLGNEKIGGMLTTKQHLDPKKPDSFAPHYEAGAQNSARTAKDNLRNEVEKYAHVLENDEIEKRLDDLVQKLCKITNLFEITPELEESTYKEVDLILGGEELSE